MLKHSAGQELLHAIREVSCGRVYITPLIAHEVISVLAGAPAGAPDLPHLTSRQRQVLQLVAEGHSMKGVAAMLNVSRRTAETHKYQLMAQLGVHSTAGLVQYAFRAGILSLDDAPLPHAPEPADGGAADGDARGPARKGASALPPRSAAPPSRASSGARAAETRRG